VQRLRRSRERETEGGKRAANIDEEKRDSSMARILLKFIDPAPLRLQGPCAPSAQSERVREVERSMLLDPHLEREMRGMAV
jgi:hypothetical protein